MRGVSNKEISVTYYHQMRCSGSGREELADVMQATTFLAFLYVICVCISMLFTGFCFSIVYSFYLVVYKDGMVIPKQLQHALKKTNKKRNTL